MTADATHAAGALRALADRFVAAVIEPMSMEDIGTQMKVARAERRRHAGSR